MAMLQLILLAGAVHAQMNPRGVTRTPANVDLDREAERDRTVIRRVEADAPRRNLILREIKNDFVRLQELNDGLLELIDDTPLNYNEIATVTSKIKTVAARLDSNLVLGELDGEKPSVQLEISETALRSSLASLSDLVISFLENPVFIERGVFDVEQTRRAKHDVDSIIAISAQAKKLAKKLSQPGRK